MTLRRSDKQYLDVESFEEYEFTKCIAYEMAIRNDRVIEILTKAMITTQKRFKGDYQLDKELQDEDEELFSVYGIREDYHTKYHFFEEANKIMKKDFKEFLDYYNSKGSKPKKADFERIEGNEHSHFKEHDGFYRNTVINIGSDTHQYKKHSLSPKFKRPILYLDFIDNDAYVYIDLSLPENELVAYIKHLKKAYNKDLLDSPYDDLIKTGKNKKSFSKGSKMADIFYIYDCLKLGHTKRKIQNEVYNYYADQGIETKTLDYKTLNKYNDIAVDYIDNKRYLELVTGKKLEELENRNFKN